MSLESTFDNASDSRFAATDIDRIERDTGAGRLASILQRAGTDGQLSQMAAGAGDGRSLPGLDLVRADHQVDSRTGVPLATEYMPGGTYETYDRRHPVPDTGSGSRDRDWYQELPDGTRIWRYPDGTYIRIGADGSYERRNPDGSYVVRDARGNTVWHYTDGREYRQGADGSLFVRQADGSTYEKTADGRQVWQYADGTVIRQNPDGSSFVQRPDGSSVERLADGTTIWKRPDGTILRQNPDGSKEQRNADGSVFRQLADGTIIRQTPDGMTDTQFRDGRRLREWPDRSRVEIDQRGLVTKVVAANGASRDYFYDGGGQLVSVRAIDGQVWQRQDQYTWVSDQGNRWRGVIAGVDFEGNAYYYPDPQVAAPFIHRRDGSVAPWDGRTPANGSRRPPADQPLGPYMER